jgi:hypothetical protein
MPCINTAYRLYYAARDYRSGLTNVRYYVYKPNGNKTGPYAMTELNSVTALGIYYDDYLDADMEGNYIFLVDCPAYPKRDERSEYFFINVWKDGDRETVLDSLKFIKDIEGGAWKIIGNQMIFYKNDNITEVLRVNLFNEAGIPANRDVLSRIVV